MINLEILTVSLTKFGYHKLADLLLEYPYDEVLDHLADVEGDKIDKAQARGILSYEDDQSGMGPLWISARQLGKEDLNDLIFFASILSHHRLIFLVIDANKNRDNRIYRENDFITTKEYTNFARSAFELGFIVEEKIVGREYVTLDISRVWYKFYLANYMLGLIRHKLIEAGYKAVDGEIVDVALELELNQLFALSAEDFREWIGGTLPEFIGSVEENREAKPERSYTGGLKFTPGHLPKFEGNLQIKRSTRPVQSTLIHNRIQTKIYNLLIEDFPDDDIGTEIPSNNGSVDIVRLHQGKKIFYEIKTATTIRVSIRQAISQLLEYAYWTEIPNIEMLIIVGPNPVTDEAVYYLGKLREIFNLPIYYQFYNEDDNTLSDLI